MIYLLQQLVERNEADTFTKQLQHYSSMVIISEALNKDFIKTQCVSLTSLTMPTNTYLIIHLYKL